MIAIYLLRDGVDAEAAIVTALAAAPPVVLWLVAEALGALAELPGRLRATPGEAAGHVEELTRLARGGGGLVPTVWRGLRVAASARELLTPHAAVLPLASVPFLLAGAVSLVAAGVEIVIALVLLVALAA